MNIVNKEITSCNGDNHKLVEVENLLLDAEESYKSFQDAADALAVAYDNEDIEGDKRGSDLDALVTSHYKRLTKYRSTIKSAIAKCSSDNAQVDTSVVADSPNDD